MATKPTGDTSWALNDITDPGSGQANKVEQSTTKKNNGWSFLEKAPFNWFNYWMNAVHKWLGYFEDYTEEIDARILIENITANQTLEVNKKYKASGVIELTLPSAAVEGDTIKIFVEDSIKLLQSDVEHGMSYLNKYFTTKGINGYLELLSKNSIELVYKGNGDSRIEPGVKLPDPATLPLARVNLSDFSLDDLYLACGGAISPYINIYKRNGDTFTKLSNPASLPPDTISAVTFTENSIYLAVSHSSSPYITIYKRTAGTDTFVKLPDPATLPAGTGNECHFSPNGDYLAVAHINSPYITIYKRNGDTFTKLSNPATLPPNNAFSCAFSYDNNYLAVGHFNSPYITIYKRNGDTFTKLSNPASLPGGGVAFVNGCHFSYDNKYLVLSYDGTPYILIYKIDNEQDTFTKLSDPATTPGSDTQNVRFSYDGKYLVITENSSPYMNVYKIEGDTFTRLSNPATLPGGQGLGCAFSYNGKYMLIGFNASPYIHIYKLVEDTTKAWLIETINTLYEQSIEYLFK